MVKIFLILLMIVCGIMAASDDFTGDSGTALATHDANWSLLLGDGGAHIVANSVGNPPYAENSHWAYSATSSRKAYVKIMPNMQLYFIGPLTCLSASNDSAYGLYFNNGRTGLRIAKIVGSGYAGYSTMSEIAGTWDVGTAYVIGIEVDTLPGKDSISAFVDGEFVGYWNDETNPIRSGELSGIALHSNSGTSVAQLDDWSDQPPAGATCDTLVRFEDTSFVKADAIAWGCSTLCADTTGVLYWQYSIDTTEVDSTHTDSTTGVTSADEYTDTTWLPLPPSTDVFLRNIFLSSGTASDTTNWYKFTTTDSVSGSEWLYWCGIPTIDSLADSSMYAGDTVKIYCFSGGGKGAVYMDATQLDTVLWTRDSVYAIVSGSTGNLILEDSCGSRDSIDFTIDTMMIDSIRPNPQYRLDSCSAYGVGLGSAGTINNLTTQTTVNQKDWSSTKVDFYTGDWARGWHRLEFICTASGLRDTSNLYIAIPRKVQ
jgi:hypothetical protein